MISPLAPAGDGGDSPPIACTLTTADLAAQAGRWERLGARAMIGRAKTAGGLRIRFRPGPGVAEELRALVAVERQCCAWATWTVRTSASGIVLEITADADGAAVLHRMFTSPRRAPGPAH